jgi:hypothetical protein
MSHLKSIKSVLCRISIAAFSLFVYAASAQAQATIAVSGSSSTLTSTGQTELLGFVTFTVVSGVTKAGTIDYFVPNVTFTNDATTGIAVSGTGGLATATIAAVVSSDIIINIPAGAGIGDSVTLSGARMSAVGVTFTTLNASISSAGNSIVAGESTVQIVRNVTDGMLVTTSGDPTFTFTNGVIIGAPSTYIVTEGWPAAFSSAVGTSGQTVSTQIIFQVTGLPDNISITFPSPLSSISGATLATVGVVPVTLTNQSATNQVIYNFTDSATSPILIDAFAITPTIGVAGTGTPGTGTVFIQATLGPIGAAVPNADNPSSAIPRFAQKLLPPASSLPQPVTTTLTLPVPGPIDAATIFISNTSSGGAVITANSRGGDGTLTSGTGINNQVTVNDSAKQTQALALTALFGAVATPSNTAAVEAVSQNSALLLDGIGTIGGKRFAISRVAEMATTYLPFDQSTAADIPLLLLRNSGTTSVSVNLTLRTAVGASVATASRTVASLGTVRESFSTLFPGTTLPASGYISVAGSGPVGSILLINPASGPSEIPTLLPANAPPYSFPFFVVGSGYDTIVSLINPSSSQTVSVTLNAYNSSGTTINAQPLTATLTPGGRLDLDFAQLLGTAQINTGYFSVGLQDASGFLFANTPQVYGIVRLSTSNFSTAAPLVTNANTQFFMTPTTETANGYTGIVITNTSQSAVSATVDLFSNSGTQIGTTTFNIAANTNSIQLLRQLIPQALTHDNGLVRITVTGGSVKVVGFRGTFDLKELIYLRGETIP